MNNLKVTRRGNNLDVMNKKGDSLIISYILLIVFVIVLSYSVYYWMSLQLPTDLPECPDGIIIDTPKIECINDGISQRLEVTLQNEGRFSVAGYNIRATNDSTQELAGIDLSTMISNYSSGKAFGDSILYSSMGADNSFVPSEIATSTFNLISKIFSIEIIPLRFQEKEGRRDLVFCSKNKIKRKVDCKLNPLKMNGLVSWWRMEGNADDEVGGNDGTISSGGAVNCSIVRGLGKACEFNINSPPNEDYIEILDNESLDITGEISIAFWMNLKDYNSPASTILDKKSTGNDGYKVYFTNNEGNKLKVLYGEDDIDSLIIPQLSTWEYYVITGNSSDFSFYINSSLKKSVSGSYSSNSNIELISIGRDNSNAKYFKGDLDEVMIFNRTLTQPEITALYEYTLEN